MDNIPRVIGSYSVVDVIGSGAYGIVVSALNRHSGDQVAIKVIRREMLKVPEVLAAFEQETRIHQSLCHENIVQLKNIIYEPDYIFVVMELCKHGDLLDWIQQNPNQNHRQIISFFYQILLAVKYLHDRDIAHLDIKPENILLQGDNKIKLADFGCCEAPPKYPMHRSTRGTLFYAAPEIIDGCYEDNRPADIWSLGILLFTMVSGVLPFLPGSDEEISAQIKSGRLVYPIGMNPDILDFVKRCCMMNPGNRPQIGDLLEDGLFELERTRAEEKEQKTEGSFLQPFNSYSNRKVVIIKPCISGGRLNIMSPPPRISCGIRHTNSASGATNHFGGMLSRGILKNWGESSNL